MPVQALKSSSTPVGGRIVAEAVLTKSSSAVSISRNFFIWMAPFRKASAYITREGRKIFPEMQKFC